MDHNAEGRRTGRNRTAWTPHQRVMHDAGVLPEITMSLTTEFQRRHNLARVRRNLWPCKMRRCTW